MKKIFNDIKKEINLFNNERNYSLEILFNDSSIAEKNSMIIYTDIKTGIDLFDNLLTSFKYKYNLRITYCTNNHRFKITK